MFTINENYLKLQGSYLFSTVAKKVAAYKSMHPDKTVISLGIGDVTLPLAPAIIEALQKAVAEMGTKEGFHGYAPERGYDFLLNAIAKEDFAARGCEISPDEIFVSDGAKCDVGNIQEIFGTDNLLRSAIRFIRSMWIQMSWQAEPVYMTKRWAHMRDWYTCPVPRKTALHRSFLIRHRI